MDEFDAERIANVARINVVGTSGSGKSTLATRLSELLNLPHVELDRLHWQPNWTMASQEEFATKIRAVTADHAWILDGNYSHTTPIKWRRVQLVVWVDLPWFCTVSRVTRRCVRRALTRQEIWPGTGNRESLRKSFLSRESVILWSMTTHGKNRRKYSELMKSPDYADVWFLRLRSPREVDSFLQAVQQAAAIKTQRAGQR